MSILNEHENVILRQSEIIENLAELNSSLVSLLAQFTDIEKYERELQDIMRGVEK